jgi:uncharacterized protein (UPF0332 family)
MKRRPTTMETSSILLANELDRAISSGVMLPVGVVDALNKLRKEQQEIDAQISADLDKMYNEWRETQQQLDKKI